MPTVQSGSTPAKGSPRPVHSRQPGASHVAGWRRTAPSLLAVAALWVGLSASTHAQTLAALNEQEITITKKSGLFPVTLEATLYKPDGPGPFPLVIINHGKESGDPKFQHRYRPTRAARYFLQRGYVVVAPMRQGFSKSGGYYIGGGCNVASNGRAQAQDVAETLRFMGEQPYVDRERVLVLGQSHGGWTTLAYGASAPPPGVRGLVNFAGGLRQESCPGWEQTLVRATADLAADVRVPSLWFYGDNDSYFAPALWQAMHKAYSEAGARARLIAFGTLGRDAHSMFASRAGEAIWQPEMTQFLQELGLPNQVVNPQFGEPAAMRGDCSRALAGAATQAGCGTT